MSLPTLSLAIVGADFPNAKGQPHRRFEIATCAPGEEIELRPEPTNPADPRAVAVYSERGVQIGYLTAERAPWIGKLIREGHEIATAFQKATPFGAVIRVAFDGAHPILPLEREEDLGGADPETGFWPDEIPPDDAD